jgi:hypothetical protein
MKSVLGFAVVLLLGLAVQAANYDSNEGIIEEVKGKSGLILNKEKLAELIQTRLRFSKSPPQNVSVKVIGLAKKLNSDSSDPKRKGVRTFTLTLSISKYLGNPHLFECTFIVRHGIYGYADAEDFSMNDCVSDTAKSDSLVFVNLPFAVIADDGTEHLPYSVILDDRTEHLESF